MKHWLLTLALICLGAVAHAATADEPTHSSPNSNPSPFVGNLTFYGSTLYYIEASTASDVPVLMVAGSGYLYGAACSSGTTGDFLLPFDSATASGLTINTKGKALGPALLTSANGSTTCTAQQTCGQWAPPAGAARFHNGLAAIKHGSNNANCQLFALTDAEIAAKTH